MAGEFNITELWPKVSPKLKRRWWAETDYGKNPPSDELKQAINEEVAAGFMESLGKESPE